MRLTREARHLIDEAWTRDFNAAKNVQCVGGVGPVPAATNASSAASSLPYTHGGDDMEASDNRTRRGGSAFKAQSNNASARVARSAEQLANTTHASMQVSLAACAAFAGCEC